MMDWNIVQAFEAAQARKRAALETFPADIDLPIRLMRAFMALATQEDRLKLVQFAESLVDPIWDY